MSNDEHGSARQVQEAPQKGRAVQGLATSSSDDPFIIATDENSIKPNAESRKHIRSHVMRGKNVKRTGAHRPAIGSWINHDHDPLISQQIALYASGLQGRLATGPNPAPFGQPGSPLRSVGELEPGKMQVISDFIYAQKKLMYPIADCVDINTNIHWFDELRDDPAYIHTAAYLAHMYFDLTQRQYGEDIGSRAIIHTNRTIALLQERLADAKWAVADCTILTVLALALLSEGTADYEATKKHVQGLYQLISLRGGMPALAHKNSLQVKCCRLDLRLALALGSKPVFFADDNISWKTYFISPEKVPATTPIHCLCDSPDARLVNVWLDLREFATVVNLSRQTNRPLSSKLFQQTTISVQYRLQHLSYDAKDRHEIMRLSMLAISTVMLLGSYGVPRYYQNLAEKLRAALQLVDQQGSQEWLKLTLWFFFVAKLSVLDGPDDASWLEEGLIKVTKALGLTRWEDARDFVKSFVWVDALNDEAGKMFFITSTAL